MTDTWDETTTAPTVTAGLADQPEIKLFARWSSSDVVVSDISLTVSRRSVPCRPCPHLSFRTIAGLHRSEGEVCAVPAALIRTVRCPAIPKGSVPDCGAIDELDDDAWSKQRQETAGH